MAIVMDGYPLDAGDLAYDISSHRGQGTVVHADQYGITMDFNGRMVSYSVGGIASNSTVRTLYRMPPIIVPLTGNPKQDTALRAIVAAVTSNLKAAVNGA